MRAAVVRSFDEPLLIDQVPIAAEGKVKANVTTEPLENINEVFARMERGGIDGRVVLTL
jgi:propanol-preferring alcohol dehydrogenase